MFDALNKFSDAQAITASAASTSGLDLSAARQMAAGRQLWVVVQCTTAMTDGGSDSTVTVTVQSDSDSAFGSPTTVQTLTAFAATSAAGTVVKAPLAIFGTAERYIRLYYTVANGNLSTGSFTAYLALDVQQADVYAKGYTIS